MTAAETKARPRGRPEGSKDKAPRRTPPPSKVRKASGLYNQKAAADLFQVSPRTLVAKIRESPLFRPMRFPGTQGSGSNVLYHRTQLDLWFRVMTATDERYAAELLRAEEEWEIIRPSLGQMILADVDDALEGNGG